MARFAEVVRGVALQLALLLLAEAYLVEWVAAGGVLGINYGVSSRVPYTLRATPEARAQTRAACPQPQPLHACRAPPPRRAAPPRAPACPPCSQRGARHRRRPRSARATCAPQR
jgi:hypothetical protein